jgi:WD40 repeat protein
MSQDSQTLVSGHSDGTIMQWNTSTGERIAGPYKLHEHRDVNTVSFSTDDSRIASGNLNSGDIRVICSHFEDVVPPFKAHDDSGQDVIPAFNTRDDAESEDDAIPPFNAHDDSESGEDAIPPSNAHDDPGEYVIPPSNVHNRGTRSLIWLPNGQLISATWDNTIKHWDTSNGSLLRVMNHGHNPVRALAITADGKLLVSVSTDGTARLWNTYTHKQIGAALQHPTSLSSVALSSDGHYLAAAGFNGKVHIWYLKGIEEVAKIIAENVCPSYHKTLRAVLTLV